MHREFIAFFPKLLSFIQANFCLQHPTQISSVTLLHVLKVHLQIFLGSQLK